MGARQAPAGAQSLLTATLAGRQLACDAAVAQLHQRSPAIVCAGTLDACAATMAHGREPADAPGGRQQRTMGSAMLAVVVVGTVGWCTSSSLYTRPTVTAARPAKPPRRQNGQDLTYL